MFTTFNTFTKSPARALITPIATFTFAAIALAAAPAAEAQDAIGVPFVGKHHLSFSVTELSRDGIQAQRAAVFGGMYGLRLNRPEASMQYTVVARAAARTLDGIEDGIVDAGVTLAATRAVPALGALSVTGAAGIGAVVWGLKAPGGGGPELGRVVASTPISAGLSYSLRVGRATIAPFVTATGAYTSEREYENDKRVATSNGWRLGHTTGVSVRFRETVLSLREINRERGLPNRSRVMFSAGMSW